MLLAVCEGDNASSSFSFSGRRRSHRKSRRRNRIPCCRRSWMKMYGNNRTHRFRWMFRGCLCRSSVGLMYRMDARSRIGWTNWDDSWKRRFYRIRHTGWMSRGDSRKSRFDRTRHTGWMSRGDSRRSRFAHIRRNLSRVYWVHCYHNRDRRKNRSALRRKKHHPCHTRFWVGWCCAVRCSDNLDNDRCPCQSPPLGKGYAKHF